MIFGIFKYTHRVVNHIFKLLNLFVGTTLVMSCGDTNFCFFQMRSPLFIVNYLVEHFFEILM